MKDCGVVKFNFLLDYRLIQYKLYLKCLGRFKNNRNSRPPFVINENSVLEFQNYLNQNISSTRMLTEVQIEIIKHQEKSNVTFFITVIWIRLYNVFLDLYLH